jgi:hypothetical protein
LIIGQDIYNGTDGFWKTNYRKKIMGRNNGDGGDARH